MTEIHREEISSLKKTEVRIGKTESPLNQNVKNGGMGCFKDYLS